MLAVTGNEFQVPAEIDYLKGVADRAGVAFEDLARGYARITAAAQGTALAGQATRDIFEAVTFSAAKLQLSVEDTAGVLRALEQIMSKGTVQAEELRGQLGDRLPGAFRIASEAMGVTTQELNDMLRNGEVLAEDFLPRFARAMEIAFNVDTAERIDTIVSAEARLGNATRDASRALDDFVGFSTLYKAGVEKMTNVIIGLTGNLDKVFKILGTVAGGLLGLASPAILAGFLALTRVVWGLVSAFTGLAAVLSGRGILAALGGIARLGIAIGGAILGFKLMDELLESGSDLMRGEALSSIDRYIESQQGLQFQIRATTEEFLTQIRAFEQDTAIQLGQALETSRVLRGGDEIQRSIQLAQQSIEYFRRDRKSVV